jgi:hypothetical protein
VILEAHGLRVELPRGWSGRVFGHSPGLATLHAGNFQLPLAENSSFGIRTASTMPHASSFVTLNEYRPDHALKPGVGLFKPHRIPLPLDPASFGANKLARARPGHVGMQHFFTAHERPFCLYVVLAGHAAERPRQLMAVNHVLRTLRIAKRR